ncbi:MAG TPA: UDP-N-acetylglucosamine 2-epimerase (non-hydrolyzing) [Bryobacterales bacterium]|jgi:UDP-N-acetylglucosamine 2-epimerase (non-hydrolysing)|nr:UDP-N-acetylglucosamine 2-epimerase (non-hydrolyzing) [Bryobacterales bacterium]
MKLACIAGARPNFVKMAALVAEIRRRPGLQYQLIHTGQHYSAEMSASFFSDLNIPPPDVNLDVGSGTSLWQTAEIMKRLEPVLNQSRPDVILVVGDVNSTLAGALAGVKLGIPVAHVEAGLRSFDRSMPEEINRVLTDAISDFLFVSEPSGEKNLLAEGVPREKIFFSGNVMIDTLLRFQKKAEMSDVLARLGLRAGEYAVATLHRPSNVDRADALAGLMKALTEIARRLPVIFPVHPRTEQMLKTLQPGSDGVVLISPLGYLDFLHLVSHACLVLTDSGGIQEETTILQVPCLTLRTNTERPVTIAEGTNILVGGDPAHIVEAAIAALESPRGRSRVPERWDGRASERILDVLTATCARR